MGLHAHAVPAGSAFAFAAPDRPGSQWRSGARKFRWRLHSKEPIAGEPHYALELTAADRAVTYAKVRYWVNKVSAKPYKAEFYSLSGRLLKTASYQNYKPLGGKQRPGTIVIEDALRQGDRSVLEYSALQVRELPDKLFTKEYLKRLD